MVDEAATKFRSRLRLFFKSAVAKDILISACLTLAPYIVVAPLIAIHERTTMALLLVIAYIAAFGSMGFLYLIFYVPPALVVVYGIFRQRDGMIAGPLLLVGSYLLAGWIVKLIDPSTALPLTVHGWPASR